MADEKRMENPPQYSAPQYPTAPAPGVYSQYAVPAQEPVIAARTGNGIWQNGICGCAKSPPWCLLSCCLPGVLLVRMGDHLKNIGQVKPILLALALCTFFGGISSGFSSSAQAQEFKGVEMLLNGVASVFGLVALVCLIIYIFKMSKLRGEIRKRYMIDGSDAKDFLTVCCCTCCCCGLHNCQMFYEVAENEKMQLE